MADHVRPAHPATSSPAPFEQTARELDETMGWDCGGRIPLPDIATVLDLESRAGDRIVFVYRDGRRSLRVERVRKLSGGKWETWTSNAAYWRENPKARRREA